MSTVPASEPRMTRSRARALGGATPVRDVLSNVKKAATALLTGGKSKAKRSDAAQEEDKDTRASPDVATNLFSKEEPSMQASPIQEFAARDQDQSCFAAEQEEQLAPEAPVPVPEAEPAPVPAADMPEAALTITQPATPQPAPQSATYEMDDMAITPAPEAAESAAPMSPAVRAFGTPLEMDAMATSPMQITSPAVMAHMSPAMDHSCTPQQPITEEFSFELPGAAVAEALQSAAPVGLAVEEPISPAGRSEVPQVAAAVPAALTPTQPVRSAVKTPRSASMQGAAARSSVKPPMSATKAAASRTPIGQRATPVASSNRGPTTAERPAHHASVKSALRPSDSAAQTVTPAGAKAASSLGANKTAGQRTAKRVSIATPVGSGSTANRPIVCTPYPRSGSKTPVTWAGAAVEAEDVQNESDDCEDVAAGTPMAVAMHTAAATPVAAVDDPAARLVDATMQLAAALPPSTRATCEEAPAPLPAATPVPAVQRQMEDAGMDVDMDEPATFTLATGSGMTQEAGTPEFAALASTSVAGASTPMAIATMPMSTPTSARPSMAAKLPSRATPGATTPKLTIPGATAAYMASTKSFEQKARPLQAGSEAAAAMSKPRVKSQVVGVPGDDRSLKQLKREIKAAMEAQKQDIKGLDSDDEMEEASYNEVDEAMLVDAMSSKANISKSTRVVLNGVPAPQGTHMRFCDDGKPVASPSNGRVYLKGLPAAAGKHMHFD